MKYKTIFIHILTDIRFWILVSVCLRFECLLSPPIMWRETLTASIARNFLEIDNNIFYPRVDIGGERTGIIAGEFPFYNYLIYLLYKIFGYANWYGRPLNILITAWGALAFHSIVKRMLGESIAFYATIFFTFSIMFPFSHRIMPDTIAVSLALIGVYYGWRWLEANSVMYLVLSFIFVALGLLNKMPAFCVVWLLGFPLLQPHFSIRGRKILVFSSTIATLLMVVWYFLWVPYLLKTYDYQLFWTTTFTESWTKWGEHYDELWRRLHTNLFGNALTFFLAIMGVGTFLARKPKPLVWMMAGYFLTYLYFILKTGHVFPTHDYYTIPIAPLAAIMAGYGLETLTDKQYLKYLILIFLSFLSYQNVRPQLFVDPNDRFLLTIPKIINQYVGKKEPLMIVGGEWNPTFMFFAERRGWQVGSYHAKDEKFVAGCAERTGLRYIFVDKRYMQDSLPYALVYEDTHFKLFMIK